MVIVVCDTLASHAASIVTRPRGERCHTMSLQVRGVVALAGSAWCDGARRRVVRSGMRSGGELVTPYGILTSKSCHTARIFLIALARKC